MLQRLAESRFAPGWQERKHRQTVIGAALQLFGADLSDQLYNEIVHRAGRTGSPYRPPQPLYEAVAKVLRDHARKRGTAQEAMARLEAQVKAQRNAARRRARELRAAGRTETASANTE